ncbi:hypothetical protein [Aliikangiella maris]|uniref:Lipoprotein n=2 Tax=Aliikangiella maris TaxID=3162458 RepID=A0ABV2BUM3_9GAMM
MQKVLILVFFSTLIACTTQGKLEYITSNGERKVGCETEYSGAPSIDKYAVEYVLSYCAKNAEKQGHQVIDKHLLTLDLSIPKTPSGDSWSFEYATELHKLEHLTDKEYGYIIAFIDLSLNKSNNQLK